MYISILKEISRLHPTKNHMFKVKIKFNRFNVLNLFSKNNSFFYQEQQPYSGINRSWLCICQLRKSIYLVYWRSPLLWVSLSCKCRYKFRENSPFKNYKRLAAVYRKYYEPSHWTINDFLFNSFMAKILII